MINTNMQLSETIRKKGDAYTKAYKLKPRTTKNGDLQDEDKQACKFHTH